MEMIQKIRRAIDARGITQDALERSIGLPQGRISKWAGGQGEPTARQAWRIARAIGVPLEYLIDDEMTEPGAALDYDTRALVDTYQALGLDLREAIRRLHSPATGMTQAKPIPPEATPKSKNKDRTG